MFAKFPAVAPTAHSRPSAANPAMIAGPTRCSRSTPVRSAAVLALMTAACGGGGGGATPSPASNGWTVFTDATDGRIASFVSPQGERLLFLGERDASGIPVTLTDIQATAADGTSVL